LALRFQLPPRVRDRLRSCAVASCIGAVVVIASLMPTSSAHAQYVVTETTDDGTGATAGTLSNAILQANATGGTISFNLNGGPRR